MIERTEWDRLRSGKAKRLSWFAGESGREYLRDLRVVETGPLPFPGVPDGWGGVEFEDGSPVAPAAADFDFRPADDVEELYSERAFRETEEKLRLLPAGSDFWSMLSELGAYCITNDHGLNYAIAAKGFFGEKTRSMDTEDGLYKLRPFGYMEDDREVIKLIAVFKNDQLEKVVPHTGLADWSGYLTR